MRPYKYNKFKHLLLTSPEFQGLNEVEKAVKLVREYQARKSVAIYLCKVKKSSLRTALKNIEERERERLKRKRKANVAKVIPKNQSQLQDLICELFPGESILTNTKKEAQLKHPQTGSYLELDIWIPSLRLSFEFQDSYHYTSTWYSHRTPPEMRKTDSIKEDLVSDRGETLIHVPFWWDGKKDSLIATIKSVRPDLLSQYKVSADKIPESPPSSFFSNLTIPDVGELMLASFPPSDFAISLITDNRWWAGEKYDGIRCCWHATKRKLYTRSGLILVLPSNILSLMGNKFIDSEIWFGKGSFHESQQFIRSSTFPSNLEYLRVIAFDDPSPSTHHLPFETRYASVLSQPLEHPYILPATRVHCTSRKWLKKTIEKVIKQGGEGLILRKFNSTYERGRSPSLLKLKASRADKEALVLKISGSLYTLQLPNQVKFVVDTHGYDIIPKPIPGDVVTFSYQHYTKLLTPVNPKIERVRGDMSWQQILHNYQHDVLQPQTLNDPSHQVLEFAPKTYGYYPHLKRKKLKILFSRLAKKLDLDPLNPTDWYNISPILLKGIKKIKSILKLFGGNFVNALLYLFPDIGLDASKFKYYSKNYWDEFEHRREYFVDFAETNHFDPHVPNNWLSVDASALISKGGKRVLSYYNNNISSALGDVFPGFGTKFKELYKARRTLDSLASANNFDPLLAEPWYSFAGSFKGPELELYNNDIVKLLSVTYPDIRFEASKFSHADKKNQCKLLFERYAEINNFDPRNPENWYSVQQDDFIKLKGATSLLVTQYQSNIVNALMDIFPNIGLDRLKFSKKSYWHSRANRRKLFENFAKSTGFDPLLPESWYSVKPEDFGKVKGANAMLMQAYNSSFISALLDIFPDIGLERKNFKTKKFWAETNNQREFFLEVAQDVGFDALVADNWYSVPIRAIENKKGATSIVYYHKGLANAILSLFPNIGLVKHKFSFAFSYVHWKARQKQLHSSG